MEMRKWSQDILVASICFAAMLFVNPGALADEPPDKQAEKIILVLPFYIAGDGGGYEVLGEGLQDLFIADLSSFEDIQVVDRTDLYKVLAEQRLSLGLISEKENQIKVGRIAGANLLLAGTFTVVDSRLKINAHLFEIATSRLVRSREVEGNVEKWFEAQQKLARMLVGDLELKMTKVQEDAIENKPTVDRFFIRGVGYYCIGDYDRAIMEFMNTLRGDNKYVDARYWMAKSYIAEKEYDHARIELTRIATKYPEHKLAPDASRLLKEMDEIEKSSSKE